MLFTLVFVFFPPLVSASATPQANDLYKKRKFDEAIAEYDLAISAEPNDATSALLHSTLRGLPSTSLHLSVTSCYHPLPALQHPHTSQHSPSLWGGFSAYSFILNILFHSAILVQNPPILIIFFGISAICTDKIKVSWNFATNIFEIFRKLFSKS